MLLALKTKSLLDVATDGDRIEEGEEDEDAGLSPDEILHQLDAVTLSAGSLTTEMDSFMVSALSVLRISSFQT